ncbi:MAG TPA: phage tail tube protein [Acidothermaceae bacterium]|jgi:hypothetical protein
MTTGIPSGLGATWGVAPESAVGTATTSGMRWPQFDKAPFSLAKKIVQSQGLHGGLYEQAPRRAYTSRTAKGQVTMDLIDKQLGLLFKHMLGSSATTTQQASTTAYLQTHTPGDTLGLSLSVQIGKPETSGTIQQFTYPGCKITDWSISTAVDQIGKLDLTFDGWDEQTTTGYAAPSYVAADVLHFAEASLLLGGTASTTSGVVSVSGGTALAVVKSATVKGTNALAADRIFIGSAGLKAEQLSNGFRKITGDMEVEFENISDTYAAFTGDTSLALQLVYTGGLIASTYHNSVSITIPNVHFDMNEIDVDGPAVLTQKVSFTGLDDGTNPPIQIQVIGTDTSI